MISPFRRFKLTKVINYIKLNLQKELIANEEDGSPSIRKYFVYFEEVSLFNFRRVNAVREKKLFKVTE